MFNYRNYPSSRKWPAAIVVFWAFVALLAPFAIELIEFSCDDGCNDGCADDCRDNCACIHCVVVFQAGDILTSSDYAEFCPLSSAYLQRFHNPHQDWVSTIDHPPQLA